MEIPIKPKDIKIGMLLHIKQDDDYSRYGVITKITNNEEFAYQFWAAWADDKDEAMEKAKDKRFNQTYWAAIDDEYYDMEDSISAFKVTKLRQVKLIENETKV